MLRHKIFWGIVGVMLPAFVVMCVSENVWLAAMVTWANIAGFIERDCWK